MKEIIQKDDISIINIYAINTRAPNFVNEILLPLNSHIYSDTLIVGNFNTLASSMDRSSRQK